MSDLCPWCLNEMVEQYDYDDDVPCLYCPVCGEVVYLDGKGPRL